MGVKFTYLMRQKTRFNGFKDSGLQALNVIQGIIFIFVAVQYYQFYLKIPTNCTLF